MKLHYLFPFFLIFELTICKGQNVALLDSFCGKPVIPFTTPLGDKEFQSKHDNLLKVVDNSLLERRENALDFFKTLNMLSEPSTLSGLGITDLTYSTNRKDQKKPYILNADIQTPIALGGSWFGLNTIHVIPHFKVRIFQNDSAKHRDYSMPVRTPSYLPGIIYYHSFPTWWVRDNNKGLRGKYLGLHIFHHSNGQDGPEFIGDSINVYNGNFSELIVGEIIFGLVKEYSSGNPQRYCKRSRTPKSKTIQLSSSLTPDRMRYLRVSLEYHDYKYSTNSEFNKYNLYGRIRLNTQLGLSLMPTFRDIVLGKDSKYYAVTPDQLKESWRFVLNVNYILDPVYNSGDKKAQNNVTLLNIAKRGNFNFTAYWRRALASPNAALFIQFGYYGSDNYNIYFQQSFFQLRLGLALAFFKYPRSADFQKPVYLD